MIERYAVLGPMPCIECHRTVIWERVGGRWFLGELTDQTIRHHNCRPRCHKRMRTGKLCQRLTGHSGVHSEARTLERRASWMRARAAA